MDVAFAIAQLEHNAERILRLVDGVSAEQSRFKPDTGSWSILEVMAHLYDEEREDFRARLDYMLDPNGKEWPSIDPMGWVTARGYNTWDIAETMKGFSAERTNSLTWLKSLDSPNWERAHEAPWGIFKAGEMFAAWVAHDLLHMRQLVELQYAWTTRQLQPYGTRYAGEW